METLARFYAGILSVALVTQMITTPEQREEWARQSDWDYYASNFSD